MRTVKGGIYEGKVIVIKKFLLALTLTVLVSPSLSAGAWEGKVIGIRNCRAIIVFDGKNFPVTVLLDGVDQTRACPKGAKRFISKSVFGEKVDVKGTGKTDGGIVGEVIMADGKSLNKELLRQEFMRTSPALSRKRKSGMKDSSSAARYPEPPLAPGVRKWRDKDGNIHFSGTVGGRE